jgi:hypothetical protein
MKTANIMLGEIPIDEYVVQTENPSADEWERVSELVRMLGGPEGTNSFGCERLQLEQLCQRKAELEFPGLDLSFLGMKSYTDVKSKVTDETYRIPVPRFGVYPINDVNLTFHVDLRFHKDGSNNVRFQFNMKEIEVTTHQFTTNRPREIYRAHREIDVPSIFAMPLVGSIGKYVKTYRDESRSYMEKISHDCIGNSEIIPDEHARATHLQSTFNGIIPERTRERIRVAAETFKKEDMYLIAEVKPEDWNVGDRITEDPLVVGVAGEKAHLIDHFETTPMEDYVRREFGLGSG